MEAVAVRLARSQWEEGSRRFDEAVKQDPRLLDAAFHLYARGATDYAP